MTHLTEIFKFGWLLYGILESYTTKLIDKIRLKTLYVITKRILYAQHTWSYRNNITSKLHGYFNKIWLNFVAVHIFDPIISEIGVTSITFQWWIGTQIQGAWCMRCARTPCWSPIVCSQTRCWCLSLLAGSSKGRKDTENWGKIG